MTATTHQPKLWRRILSKSRTLVVVVVQLLAILTVPAVAQDAPTGDAPPPAAPEPAHVEGRQSYTAADFARFAPTTALDMLNNVPGFLIRADGSRSRGLGQATDNVLVNSQRLSSKSDDLYAQLGRIPASSVVRIDVVDGATLAIPGLSGQVADVITRADVFSGSFNWRGEARAHFAHPGYTNGEVSIKGTAGRLEYTAAIANEANRGAFGGPYQILNADRSLREARDGRLWSDGDSPKISGALKYTWAGGSVGNLNASYGRFYGDLAEPELQVPVIGPARQRDLISGDRNRNYEIGGDYQFGVLGAQLKLIGLNRAEHNTSFEQVVSTPSDGSAASGGRYEQVVDAGEVIGRAELSWKWGKADWQLAGEAAFNRLDKDASLFELAAPDSFVEVAFPQGDGGVREDRYEASVSYGRPLTSKLSLQGTIGAEHSTISKSGPMGVSRSFLRPKGSLSLAWAPEAGLDISLKIERAVGQLNFNDFLGRVFLDDQNQNDSNFELVPSQSWNGELATKKDLGEWGSTNLRLFYRDFEDYVDLVPLPGGGEGRGNIDRLRRHGFEWTSTFKLDPIGFRGAKIDSNVILQTSRLIDPLTGEKRQMDRLGYRVINVSLRHDIPGSDWAWGAGFEHLDATEYHRINEVGRDVEGPIFDSYFVENKDVFGMTVHFDVINLTNARHNFRRTVYTGRRGSSPINFIEEQSRLIGPIFRLSIKGNF